MVLEAILSLVILCGFTLVLTLSLDFGLIQSRGPAFIRSGLYAGYVTDMTLY
jgi:hypothetical protein